MNSHKLISATKHELKQKLDDLYEDRLLEDFPECSLDEVENLLESKESVSAYFGSSGYSVTPYHLNNYEHTGIFLHGYCALFAYVYAQRYDLDEVLVVSQRGCGNQWSGHIFVIDNENYIDAEGSHLLQEILQHYPASEAGSSKEFVPKTPVFWDLKRVSSQELWNLGILDKTEYDNPLDFIDDFEKVFTISFVDHIFDQVSLTTQ